MFLLKVKYNLLRVSFNIASPPGAWLLENDLSGVLYGMAAAIAVFKQRQIGYKSGRYS
jgi:hypothetical protein